MSQITYFVVQPYLKNPDDGRIYPGQAHEAPNKIAAEKAATVLKDGIVGAVAFSRTGDPEYGDWDDAVTIAINGEVIDQAMVEALPW